MKTNILFEIHILNPVFRDALIVSTIWKFPFLPRVGESVYPAVWINDFDLSILDKILTSDGKVNLSNSGYSPKDWLHDICVESSRVRFLTYNIDKQNKPIISICLDNND